MAVSRHRLKNSADGEEEASIIQPKTERELTSRPTVQKVHIEVSIHPLCPVTSDSLRRDWQAFFQTTHKVRNVTDVIISGAPSHLQQSCLRIAVEKENEGDETHNDSIDTNANIDVHPYTLSQEEASTEQLDTPGDEDESTAGCDHLPLPHQSLDGLWESLILPAGVKRHLLDYAQSALLFSEKGVSPHIVGCNRLLLLHGPPGTGKTSLCRALAQKLAIRLGHRFPSGCTLLEIHSHSLFSKWFSTSGKLVNRLFQVVRDMVQDDPESLVCVLMDEVESLASARSSLGGAGEPSDAMRAVNSLLTSLDRLRGFPNVIVLATTNITQSIDLAFIDRADLKQFVGMPILEARYEILRTCLVELVRVGIIKDQDETELSHFRDFQQVKETLSDEGGKNPALSSMLLMCARKAQGMSGRSLRRLPFQSHAQFIRGNDPITMKAFLHALGSGIEAEHHAIQQLDSTYSV